jgi:signal transduction histidine kinase
VRGEQMELFVPRAKTDRGSLEIRCSLVDRDGGIWLATRLGVWQVLGGMGWRAYGTAEGLPSQTIWGATRDPQGRFWVSTEEGLCVSQGDGWNRILPTRMFNMVVSRDGALWTAGSPGGTVIRIDLNTLGVQRHKVDVLPQGGILTSLTLDNEGQPWVADSRAGLARGRQEGRRWVWERVLLDGRDFRDVRNLFTDPDGRVMVVHVGGVAIWHRGRWSQLEGVLDALPLNMVFDGRGQLLVSYLNRPVITRYQLLDGDYHSVEQLEPFAHRAQITIYSMGFEASGRLWMGTSKGAVRLDLGRPESLRIFGADDGIVFTDCNQNALFMEKDRVWIGTSQGLASCRTDLPDAPALLRAPVLLSAQTSGKALPVGAPVMVLPQDSRNLDLRFLVPTYFRAQGGITYQSRLAGADQEWVNLDQPRLRYPSMHPGRYLLEIRGLLEDGQAGPSLALRFEVLPRWWESRLAWVCYTLLGAGAVYGLVRMRQAQLETRNRELREEVARQTEVAHLASQAKSAFLAHMSHELRTPLSAILLYSELLQEDASAQGMLKIKDDATKIHGAGRHLLGLIDGILDLSKIEAGHMKIEIATVALGPFLTDLVTTLEPVVTRNGNRFEAHLDGAPDQIRTDAVRLRQVLSNLLGNAAKFTKDGQVILQVEATGAAVQFTVSDTGIGMSEEALARVFDEFVQADTSTARKYGGTGLGLALVRRFSELLGGRVEVHSQLGKETTFIVTLPIAGPSGLA